MNPVDFIALEFLRVFEPAAYGSIRDNGDVFCGSMTQVDYEKASEKAYFEKWRDSLPEPSRAWVVALVGRMFPKVAEALDAGRFFSGGDHREWRRELRACSADCFSVYFQFALSPGCVSRRELDRLASQESSESMAALLLEARDQILPDGHSKARDLIDRLRDFDELDAAQAEMLVEALVANAHLLLRKEDEGGFFALPNRWRIMRLATDLLERLDAREREYLLARLAAESQGLWAMVDLADSALQGRKNPSNAPKCMLDLGDGFPEFLTAAVGKRLRPGAGGSAPQGP